MKLLLNIRILYVTNDYWIGTKGYKLFKYNIHSKEWIYFARLNDVIYNFFSRFFLTRRLLRAEIRHLYHFNDDEWFCIAKKGLFRLNKETKVFDKICHIERGSRPMNLCQDMEGSIYFGEYFYNKDRLPISIYKSVDYGDTWQKAYTFSQGEIGHIHGIYNDPFSDKLWILTGDIDEECLIGYTEDGFKTLNIVFRGIQDYRACNLLFFKDNIVFATDSQYQQNKLRSFDRVTLEVTELCNIQGTGIYGGQKEGLSFISTTVEPSSVNLDRHSYLWISKDGVNWENIMRLKKDGLRDTFFQFGSIRFPIYENPSDKSPLIIDGRALKELDGKSLIINL